MSNLDGTSPSPPSPSPSPSSYHDESSEIDELEHRSRKLNKLLRKNVNKADRRKQLLDMVRNKAWVLENEVNLLEKQAKNIKETLVSKSFRRKLIVFTAFLSSIVLVGFGVNQVVHGNDSVGDSHYSNMDEVTRT